MRGSMRQRKPGVWELRVHLGRDPVSGKVRQRSKTVHGGRRDAERHLAELVAGSAEHRAPATAGTVAFLLDEWFADGVDGWSPTTARNYRLIIDRRLVPAIGAVELRKLTVKHLDDLYRGMTRRGLAARTVRQTHAVIRRALEQAQRWGWVSANVATLTQRPQVHAEEVTPPTVAELHRILAEAPTPELATLWRVKAELGARRGEMAGLQWCDVDWVAGVVTVRRSVIHGADRDLWVKDTKTHQVRRVSLDVGVLNLLAEHRVAMEARATAEGSTLAEDGFVWSHEPDGRRPWRPDYLTLSWSRARGRAGLPGVRQHDLRHLNATLQMAAGIPLKTIQKRLGHATSALLHSTYGHALPADDQVAAELLGRLLGGTGESGD
jgi:integrase